MAYTVQLRKIYVTFFPGPGGKTLVRVENTGDIYELPDFIAALRNLLQLAEEKLTVQGEGR